MIEVVDPATGLRGERWDEHDGAEADRRLERAHAAWDREWRHHTISKRAERMRAAAATLRAGSDRFATRMADEMGKPLAEGRSEIEKCAWVCEHAADNAAEWLAPEPRPSDADRSYVRYDPLGVVLAIMPWNFPFWQLFRFAAPAMMAGNTFLLKHASNVPGCAQDIEDVFRDAGFPDGLCAHLRVGTDAVADLIADPRIAAVTLTGSTEAGRKVAALAGRALKPAVLELGGSDPFVVLEDADLERAAAVGAESRLRNAGQSCIAAKRFVVVRAVADRFVALFRTELAKARMGDPREEGTTLGPLARADLRDGLVDQVRRSLEGGATLELGGEVPDRPGSFYPATLLTNVGPGQPAWDEELFGPVAALRVVDDEDAAIAAANDTIYGLGASLWTADLTRAERLVPRLQAGSVFVNGLVKSDPRLPFGGTKDSGYGRELGPQGMRAFTNTRTVWLT